MAYFDTGRASNDGTEAINGLIELDRRVAHGFRNRDHYRLRMLLTGGGLAHPTSDRKSLNGHVFRPGGHRQEAARGDTHGALHRDVYSFASSHGIVFVVATNAVGCP